MFQKGKTIVEQEKAQDMKDFSRQGEKYERCECRFEYFIEVHPSISRPRFRYHPHFMYIFMN